MKRLGIILFILSLLPLVNLMSPGIMDAHDAPDHVARIANYYQALSEGVIVPRWAGNLNWGYGHPILMFLYPLPSFCASLFHFLGASFVDSTKFVFAISYVGSMLAFFLWASLAWGPLAGFVGAILYGFAPYRFVDLYVRGALGEHVAFVFPPVIFLGLLGIARGNKKWSNTILAIGVAGLLLSHNAVSLMVFPLALVYGIYLSINEAKNKKMYLFRILFYGLLGMALAAFFWVPALFEGKYTLRDIVIRGEFASRFVPFTKFFYSPWNYGISNEFTKELGIAQWVVVAMGIIYAPSMVALLLVSLFIQIGGARWIWEIITILQKFQFPWRFLTVSVLLSSVLGSLVSSMLQRKFHYLLWIIVFIAVIGTYPMWRAKSYTVRPESYYTGVYDSTTDTGESSPIWSVRFMEQRPAGEIEIIEGEAKVSIVAHTSTVHEYDVAVKTKTRFVENTLYFPGWRIFVDDVPVLIEFQDPSYRGLMTFWVEPGDHHIRAVFGETKLRRVANTISIFGLFVTIGVCFRLLLLFTMKKRTSKRASNR